VYDVSLNLAEALGQMEGRERDPSEIGPTELRARIAELEAQSQPSTKERVELARRLSVPFATLVFALLGIPLGLQPVRAVRSRGLAVSLLVILAYYLMLSAAETLGEQGRVPVTLALWTPNLLLGTLGATLFLREARERPWPFERHFGTVAGVDAAMGIEGVTPGSAIVEAGAGTPRAIADTSESNPPPSEVAADGRVLPSARIRPRAGALPLGFHRALSLRRLLRALSSLPRPRCRRRPDRLLLPAQDPAHRDGDDAGRGARRGAVEHRRAGATERDHGHAGGWISLWQISGPIVVACFGLSLFTLVWNEYVVPECSLRAHYVERVRIKKKQFRGHFGEWEIWYHGKQSFTNIQRFDAKRAQVHGLKRYEFDEQFRLVRMVTAATATWTDGRWEATEASEVLIAPDGSLATKHLAANGLELAETPEDFSAVYREPDDLSFAALRAEIADLQRKGIDTTDATVGLWLKLAVPFVSLVMVLVALPLATRRSRTATVAANVGLALVVGFSYWVVLALSTSLGRTGVLPPAIAAWSANVIFSAIGLIFFLGSE
jgi:lipopolysaccharide export system permease protein